MKTFVFFVSLVVTSAFAADTNEIAKAIRNLGAPDFKTREAASQYLSEAGRDALPALEAAAKSSDPEVQMRAQELLPLARLGVSSEMPAELRQLVLDYADATTAGKHDIVVRLANAGKARRPVLVALAEQEPNDELRGEIFGSTLEPILQRVQQGFRRKKLADADLLSLLNDAEFCQAVFPQLWLLPPDAIRRLDTLGHKKRADELFDRAYRRLEKRATEQPRDANRHNDLAWVCAVARRRLDDGLKHIELALALSPNVAAFVDTKAELLFQAGKTDEALTLAARCIELEPNFAYFRKQQERFRAGDPAVPPPDTDEP